MARKTVFPLPDDVVRHLLRGLDPLKVAFPDTSNTRPFLAAFITLVHEATGNVYGASTYRQLLKTFAPEYRPGTSTLQSEIMRFRKRLDEARTVDSNTPAAADLSASAAAPIHAPVSAPALLAGIDRLAILLSTLSATPNAAASPESSEVLQIVESECRRLQEHNSQLQTQLRTMYEERESLQQELAALRAERDTFNTVASEQKEQLEKLAAAVELAQARVADSHKFAMGRIENASAETRMWQERARESAKEVQHYKKKLADEQEYANSLRRALGSERAKEPRQPER